MARKAQVRYWESRGTWQNGEGQTHKGGYYCTHRGRQIELAVGPDDAPGGPTYHAALKAFALLWQKDTMPQAKDANQLSLIFEEFLAWFVNHKRPRPKPATVKIYTKMLNAFANFRPGPAEPRYGELSVGALAYRHAEAFCQAMRERRWSAKLKRHTRWTDGTVRSCLQTLQTALNWAALPGRGLITHNPLQGIDCPGPRSRGAQAIIAPELHQRVLAATSRNLRDVILALENTGARPGEIAAATAADWNDRLGALVYLPDDKRLENEFSHKTAAKGKARKIFFRGKALDMMRRLVQEHPTGRLFRTKGKGYWSAETITALFTELRQKVGDGADHLTSYGYRHTFITRALDSGISPRDVAELVGNTPEVISRYYDHGEANLERLGKIADRLHGRHGGVGDVQAAMALLAEYLNDQDGTKLEQAIAVLVRVHNQGSDTQPSRSAVLPFASAATGSL